MKTFGHQIQRENRLKRLAASIDALEDKDAALFQQAEVMTELRRKAAGALYHICAEFIAAVNGYVAPGSALRLDPPTFSGEDFSDTSPNLFQIGVRGRILQIEFEATPELVSVEDFRIPYTLAGAFRAFNQQMLEQELIEEHLLYFVVAHGRNCWLFVDPRTHRSGALDQEFLISAMEHLV